MELRDRQRQKEEERRQRELEAARQLAEACEARRKAEERARQYAEQQASGQAKVRKAAQILNIVAVIAIALISGAAGEIIATASGDNTVKPWRRDGSLMNTLTEH